MTYFYIKSLHIIFVVTWFAGLFYVVRLFIYNREAQDKPQAERLVLQAQFRLMIKRLWLGITWPSCIFTLIFGAWLAIIYGSFPTWLAVKIGFVIGLFFYHLSIHWLYKKQMDNVFTFTSTQLRLWNEVATFFLFAIIFLVVTKNFLGLAWGIVSLLALFLVFKMGLTISRYFRSK